MKFNAKNIILLSVSLGLALLGGTSWLLLNWIGFPRLATAPEQQEISTPIPEALRPVNESAEKPAARFTDVQKAPEGPFRYGGGTSWAPIRQLVDPAIMGAMPTLALRYTDPPSKPPGSIIGLDMLLSEQLDFLQSSQPLTPTNHRAAMAEGYELKQVPVALDIIVFVVHPSLDIPGLTLGDLQKIYRGTIKNWQTLGGPNLPIQPLSREVASGGTVQAFQAQVLKNQPFGDSVEFVPNTTLAIRWLQANPGGIYFASSATVLGQCTVKPLAIARDGEDFIPPYQPPYIASRDCPQQRNRLNTTAIQAGQYPLTRQLFVVIKENGQREQQAGQAYADLLLTAEGQQAIQQAGYINLQ